MSGGLELKIKKVNNGYLVIDDEREDQYVFANDISGFAECLRHLDMELGPTTSRYSPQRVYIVVESGDKYEGEDGTEQCTSDQVTE